MFLVVWATLRRMWLSEASVSLSALVLLGALGQLSNCVRELRLRVQNVVSQVCLFATVSINEQQTSIR